MTSSTLWQVREHPEVTSSPDSATQQNSSGRAEPGYVAAALAGALTLILMSKPWLTASGPSGRLASDPFGRIDGTTRNLANLPPEGYAQTGADGAWAMLSISGAWTVLAALSAVVTISAAVLHLRNRTDALAYLVIASAAATAVFILIDLLYLGGKASDLRAAVDDDQSLRGGSLLGMFLGDDTSRQGIRQVASAGLTAPALLGGATAFGGAVAAIATGMRRYAGHALEYR